MKNRLDLSTNNTLTADFLGLHLDDGFLVRVPPQFTFENMDVATVSRHRAKPGPLQYVGLPKAEVKDRPVFFSRPAKAAGACCRSPASRRIPAP